MKEQDIILGCQQFERKAQRAFVDRYSSQLMHICVRYAKDEAEAKDMLQESLIHILNKITQFDIHRNLNAWIHTVTVRKCIECIRRYRMHAFSDLEDIQTASVEEVDNWHIDSEAVWHFIQTLPEKYRIVINMYIVEGYNHNEIASFLQINESSSRSLLTRARQLIQKKFLQEGIETSKIKYL